jgi:hypothetical protein
MTEYEIRVIKLQQRGDCPHLAYLIYQENNSIFRKNENNRS